MANSPAKPKPFLSRNIAPKPAILLFAVTNEQKPPDLRNVLVDVKMIAFNPLLQMSKTRRRTPDGVTGPTSSTPTETGQSTEQHKTMTAGDRPKNRKDAQAQENPMQVLYKPKCRLRVGLGLSA